MRIIAFIEDDRITKKILRPLGLWATHNHDPLVLRFAVLWRKRSNGTQSEKGNRWSALRGRSSCLSGSVAEQVNMMRTDFRNGVNSDGILMFLGAKRRSWASLVAGTGSNDISRTVLRYSPQFSNLWESRKGSGYAFAR